MLTSREMNNQSPSTTATTPVKAKLIPADDDGYTSSASCTPQKNKPSPLTATITPEKAAEVVTPSPRKRCSSTDLSGDLDLMLLRRCPAWSEDDELPSQNSRKRQRVSFRLELSQKTKFEPDLFGRVTPLHWESAISANESIDDAIRRAAAEK